MSPPNKTTPRGTRSERLLRAIGDYRNILVVTHDNPDPDAIAAGWALLVLIKKRLGRTARLVGGGDIVRAENRHLVKLLQPPIELVTDLDVRETTAAILIDCSAAAANHILAKANVRPVAVIDHHTSNKSKGPRLAFRDVRPGIAAAASIVSAYLREQDIVPDKRLATALCYAIRTETRGTQVHHSRLDRSVLRWLAQYMDPEWVAEIETAPLPRTYFADLAHALANAKLNGDTAICLLPVASGAEIVGEVADLLIRYEAVRSVLCAAMVDHDLVVSVRTARGDLDASQLVRATLSGLGGGGGGHAQRAGGKVPSAQLAGRTGPGLESELTRHWLAACQLGPATNIQLVQMDEVRPASSAVSRARKPSTTR